MIPSSSSSKGKLPASSVYRMTPRDQMSTSAKRATRPSRVSTSRSPSRTSCCHTLTFSKIPFRCDDFRRTVPKRADPCFHPPPLLKLAPEPEVGNLDVDAFVEQDVLEFEIAVDDAVLVQVRDAEHELTKDATRLAERQAALLDEVVEQFASGAQFRHEIDGRLGGDDFVQGEDVGMS